MSHVAPNGRIHLSAAADRSLTDALMSAGALFSLQSPALLAVDKERTECHWHTLDGRQRVPGDTHLRERRDAVSPESLRPVFTRVLTQ